MIRPSALAVTAAAPSAVSAAHRRYLFVEQGIGAGVVNFLLNYAIAWAMFRGMAEVPVWGQQSVVGDLLGTGFVLPFVTTLLVTPLARQRVHSGALSALVRTTHPVLGRVPHGTVRRGVFFGVVCALVLAPFVLATFGMLGLGEMTLGRFLWFKASFAAVFGALVTPVIALYAIYER